MKKPASAGTENRRRQRSAKENTGVPASRQHYFRGKPCESQIDAQQSRRQQSASHISPPMARPWAFSFCV
jgi:hypothetical protein